MEFAEDFVYLFDVGGELVADGAGGGGVRFEADEVGPFWERGELGESEIAVAGGGGVEERYSFCSESLHSTERERERERLNFRLF